MAPNLHWREFIRDGSRDIDHSADAQFLAANYVDFFGSWLQQDKNYEVLTFDALTKAFFEQQDKFETQVFMVADASFVTPSEKPTGNWFSGFVRLLTVVFRAGSTPFSQSPTDFTFCIVGSSNLTSDTAFLQVASWDGRTYRYYQRDRIGWNYFGNAKDAFGRNAYLGPFNGHVNGAVIMKELHEPWIHWYNPSSPGDFSACFTDTQKKAFLEAPYITQPGSKPRLLSALTVGPDVLERYIKTGVSNFFNQRLNADFFVDSGKSKLVETPLNISRWVAHILLTTTVNIAAAKMDSGGTSFQIPADHFYDSELLQNAGVGQLLQGDDIPTLQASISLGEYQTFVSELGLSMIQQAAKMNEPYDADYLELPISVLGADARRDRGKTLGFRIIAKGSEGQAPFNILQASYEDAQGVTKVQMLKKQGKKWIGLFTQNTFNALMMLDFWNPIYSWKRGVLMLYVPQQTNWDGDALDLEKRFIENVNNSSFVKSGITDSPEYQFLQLLKAPLSEHQENIANYFKAIEVRLKGRDTRAEAILDYFKLAESRRRIYRPLPLDEFGPTMPYALNFAKGEIPMLEMKSDGTIQPMSARGQKFLLDWTKSLSSVNPEIIPASVKSNGPISVSALPRPSVLALPCQGGLDSTTTGEVLASRGCPYAKRAGEFEADAVSPEKSFALVSTSSNAQVPEFASLSLASKPKTPNWEDDILPLITEPYWIHPDKCKEKGSGWVKAMVKWGGWDLGDYKDVTAGTRPVSIYRHLRSKSMPVTRDPNDYWPEEALEAFRLWANAGFPPDASTVVAPKMVIPAPADPPPTYRIRPDVMSLSKEELAIYQSKLDDILQVGQLGSKWQELGLLHAEWCLHYQEATFLWHRAFLLHVEELIDHPIPYWNGFSVDSSSPTSPYAGVPRVFFEETYLHPDDGLPRPNPLKYALSLNGVSKSGPESCFVTRDPILGTGPSHPDWQCKISLFKLYHDQITHALSQKTFTSSPDTVEGFGIPWANITEFSQNQKDTLYPFRFDFDGLFEQVHDNFHGWVGPDMADNTYTAFDPIFLSYHGNMDRLAGMFMDAHPENSFTSRFPLQPFVEGGKKVRYEDPRRWVFTTIGDMAGDSRGLGYMYSPPLSADVFDPLEVVSEKNVAAGVGPASGGRAVNLPVMESSQIAVAENAKRQKTPYVVFLGVGCTDSSYRIDVFTADADSLAADPVGNPDYIGQITRLGMGPGRPGGGGGEGNVSTRRCRKPEVTRVLRAEKVADRFAAAAVEEKDGEGGSLVQIVVTDLETERKLERGEYEHLPGFEARVVWLAT
ncbi:hypothetical protein QBC35DRAFT_59114 [Podospora australis]|uniref:tyrosinase n=1 Tax=Podospora australis TaxID=1536484 RepID=A0AAN6WMI1_9PEZI|nr:hypothetical protein QBC35DRAFT_59114 [Podospora australis]